MSPFSIFKSKPSDEKLTKKLVNFVYDTVNTPGRGVRVEDAICLMACIVGERTIEMAGEFSIHSHEFTPGAMVFSDKVNEKLIGPVSTNDWNAIPKQSVFGSVKQEIGYHFDDSDFPPITMIFKKFAESAGEEQEWGNISLSVPDDHMPFYLPLRAGYESRPFVDKHILQDDKERCLRITQYALSHILIETKAVLAPSVTLPLAFELVNGVSKTAPLTEEKYEEVKSDVKRQNQ